MLKTQLSSKQCEDMAQKLKSKRLLRSPKRHLEKDSPFHPSFFEKIKGTLPPQQLYRLLRQTADSAKDLPVM